MSWVENGVEPTLSPREQQILKLVANGYSAKEVAGHVGIAPRTVERHIENIRLKVRARNRAHMVTQAVLAGYLEIGKRPVEESSKDDLFARERFDNVVSVPFARRATGVN